jgi:hypothetical protein
LLFSVYYKASSLETPESKEVKQTDAEEEAKVTKEIEQLHEKASKEKSRNIPLKSDGSRLRPPVSSSLTSKPRRNDEIFPYEKPKPLPPAFQIEQSDFTTIKRREIVNEDDLVRSNALPVSNTALVIPGPLKRKGDEPDHGGKRQKSTDSFSSSTRFTGVSQPMLPAVPGKPFIEHQSSIDSVDSDRGKDRVLVNGGTERSTCAYCKALKKKPKCYNSRHRDGYYLPLDSSRTSSIHNYGSTGAQHQPPSSSFASSQPSLPVRSGGPSPYISASTPVSASFTAPLVNNSRCPICQTQRKTCSDPRHVEGVPYPAPASFVVRTPSTDLNDEAPVDEEKTRKAKLHEEYEKRRYNLHHQQKIQYVLPTAVPRGPSVASSSFLSSASISIARTSSSDSQRGSNSLPMLPLGKQHRTPLERLKASSMSKPVSAFREEPKRYEPSDKNARPTKSVLRTVSAYKEDVTMDAVLERSGLDVGISYGNLKNSKKKITFVEDAKLEEVIRFEPMPPFPMFYPNDNDVDSDEKTYDGKLVRLGNTAPLS